jgi:hypothetical protein
MCKRSFGDINVAANMSRFAGTGKMGLDFTTEKVPPPTACRSASVIPFPHTIVIAL